MKVVVGKLLLVLVLLLSMQMDAYAQNADSVLRRIQLMKNDSNKVKLWYELGHIYEAGQWDSAAYCYEQAHDLSRELNYTLGRLKYYPNITAVMNANGDYRKGLELNLEGLRLSRELRNEERIAVQLSNTANNYLLMQRWDTALDYYTQALKIFEKRRDTLGIANTYSNMTEIYKYNDKLEKAVYYADMAAKLSKGKNDHIYVNALDNKANMLMDLHRYEESMQTYAEAKQIAEEQGNVRVLTNITGAYMDYYLRKDDYVKTLQYAREYVPLAEATGSEEFIVRSLYGMAKANFYNKQFSEAEKYIVQAKTMAESTADVNMLKKIYPLYANTMLIAHNDVKTFHKYNTIADSLENATLNSAILKNTQELDAKYQTEKKEQQLQLQAARLKQNRLWNIVLALSAIAIAIIAIVSWRSYRNKKTLFIKEQQLQQQKIAALEQEKQLAASHAVLRGQEEERSRLAKDLHDGLGGLLSSIKFSFGNMKENLVMGPDSQQAFGRSMDMLDISIKELRRVAHSMMPEALLKLGLDAALRDMCDHVAETGISKVSYRGIGMEHAMIDKDLSVNVYRIVQELLNNTLKHSGATNILVQVTLSEAVFSLTVEDNGKGFDQAKAMQKEGIGISNIRSRVGYLNGHLDIQSSEGHGTSVFYHIQYAVNMIKLLIVDDHYMVVEGIRSMLYGDKDIEWVEYASNADSCLGLLQRTQPDIILMDISMPGMSGIDLCAVVKNKYPAIHVIALSTYSQGSFVKKMLENGAAGYLLKNAIKEEILDALKAVMAGKQYLSVEAATAIRKNTDDDAPIITRREKEVLELIAEGFTNPDIANRLFVSVTTVDTHRKNLLTKLQAKNTAALVKLAVMHKLIDLDV